MITTIDNPGVSENNANPEHWDIWFRTFRIEFGLV
jgi:hypothetical protein